MKMGDSPEVQYSIAKLRAQLEELSTQREAMTYQLFELTNSVRVVQKAVHLKWMDVVRRQSQVQTGRKNHGSNPHHRTRTGSTISSISQCSSVDPGSDSSDDSPTSSPKPEAHPSFLSRIKPKRPSSAGMVVPLRVKHVRAGSLGSEKLFKVPPSNTPNIVLAKSESIQSLVDLRFSNAPVMKKTNTMADLGEVRRSSVTGQIEPVSYLSRSSAWRASCSQLHSNYKSMSSLPRSPSTLRKTMNSISTAV